MQSQPESTPQTGALFDDRPTLERAFAEVREQAHVKLDDISLLFSEDVRDRDFAFLDRTKTKEGVIAGGIVGGTLGSIVAGMVSLGALATERRVDLKVEAKV